MKKSYVKPVLTYESFQLSQSIAACYVKLNQNNPESCQTDGGTSGFVEPGGFLNDQSCVYILEDYCITNGSGFIVTHTS